MAKTYYSDLTDPYSKRRILTDSEASLMEWWFKNMKENYMSIPDEVFDKMVNIESQFLKDKRLSDAQIEFVENVYSRYCC